ncbi:MAG TPA: glycogen debranching N-terminal domain-containing protein [Candidatus Dormibacteraeota bacterium]
MLEDRVILKENRAFVVSELDGDIPHDDESGMGLFRSDTRFLSGYQMRINGKAPVLLNRSIDRAYVATFQLANPRLESTAGAVVPAQTLSIRRTRFMHRGLHERIGIQNCGRRTVDLELELTFGADFDDIFQVRGYKRLPMLGRRLEPQPTETGFTFGYEGLDGIRRETEIVFYPVPRVHGARASLQLRLTPQQTFVLLVDVLPLIGDDEPDPQFDFDGALRSLEEKYGDWNEQCAGWETDNEALNGGLIWRSQEDLRILSDDLPTGIFPTAGLPWYACPFGRDALITSLQTLGLNLEMARGTLRYLAEHQGRRVDPYRAEEPGKILHEQRFGELANLRQIPHTPYYGTVDATPLFLVLLVELVKWTGDTELFSELLPHTMAALEWIDRYGDVDGDGFVEYHVESVGGLRNQGWKDSYDSLQHEDGRPAPLPAALIEVQGYIYDAKLGLAKVLRHLRRDDFADRLEAEALELRRKINRQFWMADQKFYAQALDRDKRQVRSISSNAGHALWSRVPDARRATHLARRLVAGDLFSGWGIRTLSSHSPGYNPMSYHNGSIWPHDNSILAEGLRRGGFRDEAELVARSVLEASMRFGDARIPELFCGFQRDRRFASPPGEYLVSCSPQAWAAGALFHLLRVLAGIEPDSLAGVLRVDPLPTPLYSRLRIEGVRVGDDDVDITIESADSSPRVKVDRRPRGMRLELPA